MSASVQQKIVRRQFEENIWLARENDKIREIFACSSIEPYKFEVLESEEAVGQAMFNELQKTATEKTGDLTIVLLGGRGAQAMYRLINKKAETGEIDDLLGRLHVFTQDALAPIRMNNAFSFVRDFERLLGDAFFKKIKSFTPMQTDTNDLETALADYLEKLENLGGIDIFFLGLGPEAKAASHLCYIKPDSGAKYNDLAGIIPISQTILEHHISKFKAGGSAVSETDEAETRGATHILTLGPSAILGAGKIVQSIVDAATAPAKKESFKRVLDTKISDDLPMREAQMDENPGLWLRLHPNVRSLVLPNLLDE